MLYTCILSQSIIIFFLTLQIIAESLNSPKFENLLLDDDLCGVFQSGCACWN